LRLRVQRFTREAFSPRSAARRSNIAAISAADGMATTWDANSNGEVNALVLSGQLIYASGHFDKIGGQTRVAIAALSATDGSPTSWNADVLAPANVLSMALSGSTLYVGGDFQQVHGVPRRNIAGISTADGTPTSFDPEANDPTTGGGVYALAVSGSTVYAAGFFTSIGGQTRNLIAGLKASDGTATSFDPNGAPGFGAFALAVASDGTLYAGGSFDTFDLAYQQGFAQFSPILKLVSAVSRKTHGILGTFDVDLPQTGAPGIECRSGGTNGDYKLVFTFANPLATVGGASVTSGTGSVSGRGVDSNDAHNYIVNLAGVTNAQVITVSLTNVTDSAGNSGSAVAASMSVLIGDTNADRFVDSADISQTKSQSGKAVTGTTFREDLNVDGFIDSADISLAKSKSGTAFP
jgi:hypothetical protein